jgi:hypothetical protein
MFIGKKKENNHQKKTNATVPSSEDSVQSLRSWVRKIEQSTNSVSSRLVAVEARLTGRFASSGEAPLSVMDGPVEKFVTGIKNGKKKTIDENAKIIDGEIHLLSAELQRRAQEFQSLSEHLAELEKQIPSVQHDVSEIQTKITQMSSQFETKTRALEQRKPLVMKLGAMEIPIEVTGIIGGLLAFTIAILVALDQKAVLLSPVFLTAVGVLLIGSAMLKMIRARSRTISNPQYPVPADPSVPSLLSVKSDGDKG